MKPAVIISLLSIVLVALVFVAQLDRVSPGPLHSVHGTRAGIDPQSCTTCHGDGTSTMADACLTCHAPIEEQRSTNTGLHGQLDPEAFAACGRCHVEHFGDSVSLVTATSFRRAGFPTVEDYRAAHDTFLLVGAHAATDCTACHPHANAVEVPADQHRYLGRGTACVSCHDDPHPTQHGQSFGSDCARCHTDPQRFSIDVERWHARWFSLETRAHRDVACASCHPAGSDVALDPVAPRAFTPSRRCVDCHPNVHEPAAHAGVDPRSTPIAIEDARDCARCHTPTRFRAVEFGAAEHAALGVDLTGRHAALLTTPDGCRQCHARVDLARTDSGEPVAMSRCRDCHVDPHVDPHVDSHVDSHVDPHVDPHVDAATEHTNAQLAALPLPTDGRECSVCHSTSTFEAATITMADHHRFGLAFTGRHLELGCEDCHSAEGESLGDGPFTEERCVACHPSPHRSLGLAATATCLPCHRTEHEGFAHPHADFPVDRHAQTGFPLTTPHALASSPHADDGLDCESCHRHESDDSPASFAERYPGRRRDDCAACHDDPHTDLTTGVFADAACVDCHHLEHFVPTEFTLDHHATTSFPLTGAHGALPCRSCHTGSIATGASSEVPRFAGTPQRCASCHDDVHDGAFVGRSCAECHSTDVFAPIQPGRVFDHERDTGFALVGRHAAIACADCHPPRPGTRASVDDTCASCHADPHAGQFTRDCDGCHDPRSSFSDVTFDHATDARYVPDAQHAKLPCDRCHQPVARADGTKVVRYRPLGTECRDCHGTKMKRGPR